MSNAAKSPKLVPGWVEDSTLAVPDMTFEDDGEGEVYVGSGGWKLGTPHAVVNADVEDAVVGVAEAG